MNKKNDVLSNGRPLNELHKSFVLMTNKIAKHKTKQPH